MKWIEKLRVKESPEPPVEIDVESAVRFLGFALFNLSKNKPEAVYTLIEHARRSLGEEHPWDGQSWPWEVRT